jgi:hypothetical protein
MSAIPRSLREIDANWLTGALREAGHEAPQITSYVYEPMPGIVGVLGEIGIMRVEYATETELPTSFVAKCPLDEDFARLYNQIMRMYPREVGFYRDLADTVPMNLAKCFVNLSDDTGDQTLLIIEHVAPARPGDILEGTHFDHMMRLVTDIAIMHGTHWMSDRLNQLPWLITWNEPSFQMGIPIVQQSWEAFHGTQGGRMPSDIKQFCERTWINDLDRWLDIYNERPWTLVHGDYELDNMLFTPTADGGEDVVVVDWQTVQRSFPGTDLFWFLCVSSNDESVAREDELLDRYRGTLATHGGPDWSRDRLIDELALGSLYWVSCMPVTTMQDVSAFGDKAERMSRRFSKFMDSSIAGATRWQMVDRLTGML